MNTITENQFYDLLALKLSGDASNEQLLLLQQQLELHPEWQFLYDQMLKPSSDYNEELTQQAYAAHAVKMQLQGKFDKDKEPINLQAAKKPLYKKMLLASAIAASVIVVFLFIQLNKSNSVAKRFALNEVTTKKGSTSNIKLPDGTEVWLNADSKLVYDENFGAKNREVKLIGEAYFDVTHDALHPFIIHTGKADIKVLGTAFNVRNYPHDKAMEATLMRGKIEVTIMDRPDEKIILRPLEKIIVANDNSSVKTENTNQATATSNDKVVLTSVTYSNTDSLIAETSWVKDKIVFINQPLEKIADELERRFAVSIVFKSDATKQYRYTGVFNMENVEEIFEILQLSKKINYTINNKQITIE